MLGDGDSQFDWHWLQDIVDDRGWLIEADYGRWVKDDGERVLWVGEWRRAVGGRVQSARESGRSSSVLPPVSYTWSFLARC